MSANPCHSAPTSKPFAVSRPVRSVRRRYRCSGRRPDAGRARTFVPGQVLTSSRRTTVIVMGLDIVMMSSPAPPIIVSALLERALPTARAAPHNGPMAVESHLIGMLADVVGSTGHRYDAKDDAGRRMDTLKVIASPAGGYLGVYHTGDIVRL